MKLKVYEISVFGVLGGLMYASKVLMEALPNIHLTAVLIMAYTLSFGKKALYPIYVFVFITGLLSGFAIWWIPYLYIWLVPFALTLLIKNHLPKNKVLKGLVLSFVAMFCGLSYGTFYAPTQALFYGMNLKSTIAWIVSGLPFDLIHGISNFICGGLITPIHLILKKAMTLEK